MPRKSSKDAILDALERVIVRQGMVGTTIEAVAAEAGVSKGGLFYHFASKKEMLIQLLERYQDNYYSMRDEIYQSLPDTPNRLIKASLLASIRHPAKFRTNIGNIVSLMDDMELRARVSDMKKKVFGEISAGSKRPDLIALAFLAADGLWVMDMFGGSHYSPEFQQKIIDELLHLVDILNSPACADPDAARAGGGREGEP